MAPMSPREGASVGSLGSAARRLTIQVKYTDQSVPGRTSPAHGKVLLPILDGAWTGSAPSLLFPGRIKREKGVWWMPWQQEAMKDVVHCDKPWGAVNRP